MPTPHPTVHAAIEAEFNRCHARAPGFSTVSGNALATAAMRAITDHVGGTGWTIVRDDRETQTRQEIFTRLVDNTFGPVIQYRGLEVKVITSPDGSYLDVDGYTLFSRRRVADNRDHVQMMRDLDVLVDLLTGTSR